jgi:hypothetical protein
VKGQPPITAKAIGYEKATDWIGKELKGYKIHPPLTPGQMNLYLCNKYLPKNS